MLVAKELLVQWFHDHMFSTFLACGPIHFQKKIFGMSDLQNSNLSIALSNFVKLGLTRPILEPWGILNRRMGYPGLKYFAK